MPVRAEAGGRTLTPVPPVAVSIQNQENPNLTTDKKFTRRSAELGLNLLLTGSCSVCDACSCEQTQ